VKPGLGCTSLRRSLFALATLLGMLLGGPGIAAAQEQGPTGGTFPAQPTSVRVDVEPSGGTSNLNGIFEPGETVLVQPAYYNGNLLGGVMLIQVAASNFTGPSGAAYTILDGASHYSIPQYAVALCDNCYVIDWTIPRHARPFIGTRPSTTTEMILSRGLGLSMSDRASRTFRARTPSTNTSRRSSTTKSPRAAAARDSARRKP
jgi:hypothetical protein